MFENRGLTVLRNTARDLKDLNDKGVTNTARDFKLTSFSTPLFNGVQPAAVQPHAVVDENLCGR